MRKNKLEQIIADELTDFIQSLDNERRYKNVKFSFSESMGYYNNDIPEDGEQVNNYSADIELDEKGRMKTLIINMKFDYN
jgi:predicted aldo/keto reductase-like oxidoreductase